MWGGCGADVGRLSSPMGPPWGFNIPGAVVGEGGEGLVVALDAHIRLLGARPSTASQRPCGSRT